MLEEYEGDCQKTLQQWELFSSGGTETSWGRLVKALEVGDDIEPGCKVK